MRYLISVWGFTQPEASVQHRLWWEGALLDWTVQQFFCTCFLWACASSQSSLKLLAVPIPGHKQPESLAAQNLARGQGIVLVRGEGDDCTSGSSPASRGTQSPRNHGPRHDRDNKGGAGVPWEDLTFLYPEPGFAPP